MTVKAPLSPWEERRQELACRKSKTPSFLPSSGTGAPWTLLWQVANNKIFVSSGFHADPSGGGSPCLLGRGGHKRVFRPREQEPQLAAFLPAPALPRPSCSGVGFSIGGCRGSHPPGGANPLAAVVARSQTGSVPLGRAPTQWWRPSWQW